MRNLLFFLSSIVFLTYSCAYQSATQVKNELSGKKWVFNYQTLEFAIPYENIKKTMINEIQPSDEIEKNKILRDIETSIKKFPMINNNVIFNESKSCEDIKNSLTNYIQDCIRKIPSQIFSYRILKNTACDPTDYRFSCSASTALDIIKNDNFTYTSRYKLNVIWGKGSSSGYLDILFKISNLTCPQKDTATGELILSDLSEKQPSLILSSMAEFIVDWNKLDNYLSTNTTKIIDGKEMYMDYISERIKYLKSVFSTRFYTLSEVSYKYPEKIYSLPFDVVLSRLQRNLSAYKFDREKSRFVFYDNGIEVYKTNHQVVRSDFTFVVNIFPESNNKTVIVYELTYKPIVDSFTGKYLDIDGFLKQYIKRQIETVESILFKYK